jgi:glycosyltransferase involved in cell wall biosynthesis
MSQARCKILFVTPGLRQGGAERQLLELMRRLPERFASVLCLFEAEEVHYQQYLPPGAPHHVLGTRHMSWRGLKRLAAVITSEQPTIVHSYRDRANFWTRMAIRLFGLQVPVLITSVRNRRIGLPNLLTEARFAKFTDRVLCNSVGVQSELISWARVPADKIEVIPNFVDLASFRPAKAGERQAARQRWGLGDSDRVLLLPGRISVQKHQLGLLWALHNLRRKGRLPPGARLLLAGRDRDPVYARVLRWLVRRWQLAEQVRLLGPVADVLSLYHAADVVVLPSLYEGMPNAAIEAHACGRPVLASHAANIDGLVRPGETGAEVPTADGRALAEALDQVLHAPAGDLEVMGEKARARVAAALDNRLLIERFTALYDSCVMGKGQPVAGPEIAHPRREETGMTGPARTEGGEEKLPAGLRQA